MINDCGLCQSFCKKKIRFGWMRNENDGKQISYHIYSLEREREKYWVALLSKHSYQTRF